MNFIDQIGLSLFFGSQSFVLDHAALFFTNAWTWLPFYTMLVLLVIKNNDNVRQIMTCLAFCLLAMLLATGLTTVIVKPLVERVRPCNELSVRFMAQIAGDLRNKDFSFFSSHAATTMALATFFTLMVKCRRLSVALYLWALTNCWTRLYLGQHYLTDVTVGIIWGIATGTAAYVLYRKTSRRFSDGAKFISSQYTHTGFAWGDINATITALLLTYLIVLMLPLNV